MSGMDSGRSVTESAGARQPVKAASVNSSLRPPTGGAVTSTSATNIRLGAAALAVAGVLFLAYPSVRPWHDESTATGASASMGSNAWVAAHFFAMVGFVLLPLGLLALQAAVAATAAAPTARLATVVAWVGCGLTLPYYGAEDFGLHGAAGPHGRGADLLGVINAVRYQPVAITIFGIGLVLIAVAAVLAAAAVWRSGVLPKTSGVLFAAGFGLFLPQFFGPAAVRIAHGALLAVGMVVLAATLWAAAGRSARPTATR